VGSLQRTIILEVYAIVSGSVPGYHDMSTLITSMVKITEGYD